MTFFSKVRFMYCKGILKSFISKLKTAGYTYFYWYLLNSFAGSGAEILHEKVLKEAIEEDLFDAEVYEKTYKR